ncbi:Uncharacterised protein [Mycobacteroides abscessus subsp. abscessus]|nr:Uncharacterised protein [Mycobacteroides abscessus subsp. abscessus]
MTAIEFPAPSRASGTANAPMIAAGLPGDASVSRTTAWPAWRR